jgi:hypothetical protein
LRSNVFIYRRALAWVRQGIVRAISGSSVANTRPVKRHF